MKRRKWDAKTKAIVVLQDLKGRGSVFNPTKYVSSGLGTDIDPDFDFEKIIGRKIVATNFLDRDMMDFKLDDNSSIVISLKDGDWSGPEAAEFWLNNGDIVVINP